MFKLSLYCGIPVHALLLLILLANDADRMLHHPADEPEDVPSPARYVVTNVASSTSLSAAVAISYGGIIVDMVTGNQYPWPADDYKERPVIIDPRQWPGTACSFSVERSVSSGQMFSTT